MQFRNIFLLLLLTGLFLFATEITHAQKITTNENGDKIILYPDGSWRYFDNKLDDVSDKYSSEGLDNENTSKGSVSDETEREQTVKNYRKGFIREAERAMALEILVRRNYEDVQFDRVLVEEELDEAYKSTDATKAEINEIKQRLKEMEKKEKEAYEGLNIVSEKARRAEEKTTLNNDDIYKLIFVSGEPSAKSDNVKKSVNKPRPKKNTGKKNVFASFDPKDDVMMYPPERKCQIAFNGVDDFSGKKRKEVAKKVLFAYTSDEMRPYFKGQDYMSCEAYLSSLSGGYKYLTLEINIASEKAKLDYGIIEKGSVLNLKLMDNTNVQLFNNKTDVGILNELSSTVIYTAQYVISQGAEKILKKKEIDKIRIIWSSGYEDYEIYDLDFFVNQFKCLNEK